MRKRGFHMFSTELPHDQGVTTAADDVNPSKLPTSVTQHCC